MWRSAMACVDPSIQTRMPVLESILQRLSHIHEDNPTWQAQMVASYIVLSMEFLKLQKQLERSGAYVYSSEQEVFEQVYNSEHVFGGYYLEGLLLSQGLWPNHFKLNEAFKQYFLPHVFAHSQVLEVGVGTGLHQWWLLQHCPTVDYWGLDLSTFAIAFSRAFSGIDACERATAQFDQKSISQGLPYADNTFDHVVMGEVLEHLDDPLGALKALYAVLKPQGYFYMTTVIFTANIDHIYLFHEVQEVRDMCLKAGWVIAMEWVYPVYPGDTITQRDRPMNIALLLQKIC